MRAIILSACLVAAFVLVRIARADDPNAFWQTPQANLDLNSLSPADVKLVSGPDPSRTFALLQTSDKAPAANYVPTNTALVPLVAGDDTGYRVIPGGMQDGALLYGDRKYKLTNLDAAFSGLTLLQTKGGHKAIVDGRFSIVLTATKPCHVFVALDERALVTFQKHGTPSWLEEYAPTGRKITTDNPVMQQNRADYLVFVRTVPAGRIALGPPGMDAEYNSMYFAFFAEAK